MAKQKTDPQTPPDNPPPPITSMMDRPDISQLQAQANGAPRQSLQGFDEDYVDIVDYIIRCTHKIWEERAMGLIYTHYAHNAKMHTSEGLVYGREAWVVGSINALAAFPDRKLHADDVIWSGNDQDGFHTSHRMTITATNTGYTRYGAPTGKSVIYQVIANCFVKANRISEEWVVRDELTLVRQLGFDPQQAITDFADQPSPEGTTSETFGATERLQGQDAPLIYQPQSSNHFDIEDFVRQVMHELWNWRLFNKIDDYFIETYQCHTCPSKEIYGRSDYLAHILDWLVPFPDGHVLIDHLYWLGNDEDGYRVACRWSFVGTHRGYGKYGAPTGKRVRIIVITHFWVKDGKFVEEWMIFDELALRQQLYIPSVVENEI
ncbi:MAG: ester cyclase family protein [Chloroflexota bacterium]